MTLWCDCCQQHQAYRLDVAQDLRFPEQGIWGDLLCAVCATILTSAKAAPQDAPGSYVLTREERTLDDASL